MAEKVELTFVANTDQYVNNVKEAQKASQNLYDTVEKNNKREKGLIEDIEDAIKDYEEAARKAFDPNVIAKYNQKLAEAKKDLKEYRELGVKAEKSTQSFASSISKWVLSLGGAAVAINALKNAFMQLSSGINSVNIAGAVFKQWMNDIVTGQGFFNVTNIRNAIAVQQQLNKERLESGKRTYEAAVMERDYSKIIFEASDRRKTDTERIQLYNQALEIHNQKIDEEIRGVKALLDANIDLRKSQPDNEKLIQEYMAFNTRLIQLDQERYSGQKMIQGQVTGLEQEGIEKRKQMFEAYFNEIEQSQEKSEQERLKIQQKYQALSEKLLKDYEDSQIESLSGIERLRAERSYGIKQLESFKKELEALGELTDVQKEMFKTLFDNINKAFNEAAAEYLIPKAETKNIFSDYVDEIVETGLQEAKIEHPKQPITSIWQLLGIDPDSEQGEKQIEALKEASDAITGILEDTLDQRVDMAERERELLDTKISELQREIDTEAELQIEGYANNLTLKQQELEELKKQREKALAEEEAAIKKQQQLQRILQTASLTSSVANILKSFTGLGPAGLAMASVAIAGLWAIWSAAKAKAAESTELAHGGSGDSTGMVKGRLHSEGGERFLDHVEVERGEKWGVLSRQASHRFGDAFDYMVSSFNKGEMPVFPSPMVSNSVKVENTGPNSRLDKVIREQQKLNASLGRNAQFLTVGSKKIIRSGNKVRIIG